MNFTIKYDAELDMWNVLDELGNVVQPCISKAEAIAVKKEFNQTGEARNMFTCWTVEVEQVEAEEDENEEEAA